MCNFDIYKHVDPYIINTDLTLISSYNIESVRTIHRVCSFDALLFLYCVVAIPKRFNCELDKVDMCYLDSFISAPTSRRI